MGDLDAATMYRTIVYVFVGFYAVNRSWLHHRLFGVGVAVLCWSFAYRLVGSLGLGLGDLRWTSTLGASVVLFAVLFDLVGDYRRGKWE